MENKKDVSLLLEDALLSKIEEVLGKDNENENKSSYLSFLRPGISLRKEDLAFCIKGMQSEDVDETVNLNRSSADFALLVNNIPQGCSDVFVPSGKRIEDIYLDVLRYSRVPKDDLDEDERANIERLRSMIVQKVKKQDLITNKIIEVNERTPLAIAYETAKLKYDNALLEYNNKRIAAMKRLNVESVQDFALNGALYKSRVDSCMREWETAGYKSDYESITSYIKMMTQRSMSILKQELERQMDMSKLTDTSRNLTFFPSIITNTAFVDENPAISENAWTEVHLSSSDYKKHEEKYSSRTSGSVGFRWSFLRKLAGEGGYSKEEHHVDIDDSQMEVSFKIAQAHIERPWFSQAFITNNSWDWANGINRVLSYGDEKPEDSNIKPEMESIPESAIFVKDVQFKSSKVVQNLSSVSKEISAGASISIGPFKIGASHNQSSMKSDISINEDEGTIKINSMQLFAFWCKKLPKTPNCTVKGEMQ